MTSLLEKHQILNCGDMKKDGKEAPNITGTSIFKQAANFITGKDCKIDGKNFEELKSIINTQILDSVKKYCLEHYYQYQKIKFLLIIIQM